MGNTPVSLSFSSKVLVAILGSDTFLTCIQYFCSGKMGSFLTISYLKSGFCHCEIIINPLLSSSPTLGIVGLWNYRDWYLKKHKKFVFLHFSIKYSFNLSFSHYWVDLALSFCLGRRQREVKPSSLWALDIS